MMRVAGRLGAARWPVWAARIGATTSLAMAACALPPSDAWNEREVERRERAYRHTQLALAYLGHARGDVARIEIASALALAPTEVSVRHAAALVDVAQGRVAAALVHFAAAAAAVEHEWGRQHRSDTAALGDAAANQDGSFADDGSRGAVGSVPPGVPRMSARPPRAMRTTLADARTLWSNYARALCSVGREAEAAHFFRRASAVEEGVAAATRDDARPMALNEAAGQRQCRQAS